MLDYQVMPLRDRTWLLPAKRVESKFRAAWSDTLDLLERELDMIRGRDVVIEVDVEPRHLTNAGRLRADARTLSPAVIVAFDSMHGPLTYRCDRYERPSFGVSRYPMQSWQANVRAVALTLEAQRAVSRYGAAERGEAYTGWKALPAGTGIDSGMTATMAQQILARAAGADVFNDADQRWTAMRLENVLRAARLRAHPDVNNGDRGQWNLVDNAEQTLRRSGWLPARELTG